MKIQQLLIFATLATLALLACQQSQPIVSSGKISQTPTPEWSKSTVIYEVNVRQYTPEGTLAAFENHLPRLKEMGVDVIWLMPIYPIGQEKKKGTLGSYYSIQDYNAVNPNYGTMDDFKHLVAKSHELGLKVILDWVANHTSWDSQWITDHPDWYAKDSTGNMYGPYDWTDVAQLDYKNTEMRAAMVEAMKFWIIQCDIDGFRCDMAGMVPTDFWENTREELEKVKPLFMLAEDEEKPELLNKAFNANYSWKAHHLMTDIAQGKKTAADMMNHLTSVDTIIPTNSYAMQFTSNHDENSWNGTEYERLGNSVKTFALLSYLIPGMPMIYSGQEAGLKKRLQFFEKDTISWGDLTMSEFYKTLSTLKKSNNALANGTFGGKLKPITTSQPEKIIAFSRQKENNTVAALINLSADTVTFTIKTEINEQMTEYFTQKAIQFKQGEYILAPLEYKVHVKK